MPYHTSPIHKWAVRIITALGIIGFALALGGCKTVPDSVKEANTARLQNVAAITADLTEARNAKPQVRIVLNLPPGDYRVPDTGWELATVEVYEPLTLLGLKALEQTDWQISENVAVTGLRVIAPLLGFGIGQYFTTQQHKQNTGLFHAISAGSFGVASQAVAKEPVIFNAAD